MSLIPGLGSLGPIGKLLDPGAMVKDVCNGILPKNMAVVGDLAGAFVDFKMGNPIGGVQHAMEALHDLPQAAKGLQQGGAIANSARATIAGNPSTEPSPPPLTSRDGKAFDWNDLLSAIKSLTAALSAHGGPATPDAATTTAAATSGATTTSALPAAKAAANSANAAPTPTPASATPLKTDTPAAPTTATTAQPEPWHGQPVGSTDAASARRSTVAAQPEPWRGEAVARPATSSVSSSSASSGSAAPSAMPAKTETSAPSPAADAPAASATTSTPASSKTTGQTITSMSQLDSMTDSAIREAVIHGRISPEVAKDSTAMMAIQQRMNSITEMNNLMTGMMRAIHDMQMAVIQNIRI
jgi:hypothetical protein